MSTIKVSELITYPIKSTRGINLESCLVNEKGLLHDRHWAIVNAENKAVTAREFPQLLKIKTNIKSNTLEITLDGKPELEVPLDITSTTIEDIKIFSQTGTATFVSKEADLWFSNYLDQESKLIFMNHQSHRIVLEKYGGKEGDVVSYADQAPILLLSEATMEELNSKMETPKTIKHFRPNIVLKGGVPNQEDQWKYIKIGACEFEVIQQCIRCVFTTIDPETTEKDKNAEPLKTLATYRKHPDGGVSFGVHLVPRKLGAININDEVEVVR